MATESYDRLEFLDKSSTEWKIKVRVTRMWPAISNETSVCKGYNLILIDVSFKSLSCIMQSMT